MIGVGDVVVCVDDRTSPKTPVVHVTKGRFYRVSFYDPNETPHDLFGSTAGLMLDGVVSTSRTGLIAAARFRKVAPADACFRALLSSIRPKVDA